MNDSATWWLAGIGISAFLPPLFIGNAIIIAVLWMVCAAIQNREDERDWQRNRDRRRNW